MGDRSASVVVIEYSDFECPFCARFTQEVMPSLKTEYVDRGVVQLAFRHLPLAPIHPRPVPAAVASECAAQQGRFWDLHDRLFIAPTQLQDSRLVAHGRDLGLDEDQYTRCLDDPATAQMVEADRAAAAKLEIRTTPTFLLGELRDSDQVAARVAIVGLKPFEEFKDKLDELLAVTVANRRP